MTLSSEMKADILDIVNARTVEVCIDSDVETLGEKPEEASGDSRDEVYLILGEKKLLPIYFQLILNINMLFKNQTQHERNNFNTPIETQMIHHWQMGNT